MTEIEPYVSYIWWTGCFIAALCGLFSTNEFHTAWERNKDNTAWEVTRHFRVYMYTWCIWKWTTRLPDKPDEPKVSHEY